MEKQKRQKMVYGVFLPGDKWGITTNRKVALNSIRDGGQVYQMTWSCYGPGTWDAPTFRVCADLLTENVVRLNHEQRLYVIPFGWRGGKPEGFSCLGFDVCYEWTKRRAEWLGEPIPSESLIGTRKLYEEYKRLCELIKQRHEATGERCLCDLTPQLIGLEGKRVEVEDNFGEVRRFWVGRSTGWIPIHLEITRNGNHGGGAVTGAPFKRVTVLSGTRTLR